jgi:thymidylate kinase
MQAQPQRFLRIDAAQSLEQVREQVLQGLQSWWTGQGS